MPIGTHSQEPMLPCEFCSELIRLAVLEIHQLECGSSRGEISRRDRVRQYNAIPLRPIQLPAMEEDSDDDEDESESGGIEDAGKSIA